jgi:hypothetical protein
VSALKPCYLKSIFVLLNWLFLYDKILGDKRAYAVYLVCLSEVSHTNTVPPFEATGRGALPRRFCKSCRKALDVFRDFDGELKTCRLCLRVRKKDTKRKRALRRADAKRSGAGQDAVA